MSTTENQNSPNLSQHMPPNQAYTGEKTSVNLNSKVENMIKFNAPKNQSSIIKVIGVGGGGSNAVNHMFLQGIKDVDFIVCNTDAQALDTSPVPTKIQLGLSLTEGRGAGANPEVGRNAAIESAEEIKNLLCKNTKMLFITAGMGGGTGTGAAPVIASISKEMGILTIGIVTIPLAFEGRKKRLHAEEGIKEMRKHVDSLLIICNDKIRELYGNFELSRAFAECDNVLTIAAKGIAEIITVPGYINVDFEDVRTVMKESGVAIMGSGMAEGEDRAIVAVKQALSSPLLYDNNIKGASDMLLYISTGDKEVLVDEITEITDFIQKEAGETAEVIWGNGHDASLGDKISITLISTGFESNNGIDYTPKSKEAIAKPRVLTLETAEEKKEIYQPQVEVKSAPQPKELDFILKKSETVESVNESINNNVNNVVEEKNILEKTEDGFIRFTKPVTTENNTASQKVELEVSQTFNNQSDMYKKESEPVNKEKFHSENVVEDAPQTEKLNKKRQDHLKDLSIKLKNPNALSELEKIPAYKRKEEILPEIPHSSESQISKYTLFQGDDENVKPQLRPNNSFLHEKPD